MFYCFLFALICFIGVLLIRILTLLEILPDVLATATLSISTESTGDCTEISVYVGS